MTTITDSRIRADWTLDALPGPECSPLPPGVPSRSQAGHLVDQMTPELRAEMEAHWARAESPIDTSTTAGKIAVMAAYERGERVEARVRQSAKPNWYQVDAGELVWDWRFSDYRIATPAHRSALEAARDRARMVPPTGGDADNSVRDLLRQIDNSVLVEAFPCEGSTTLHTFVAMTGPLTPGRYRLVRDDV